MNVVEARGLGKRYGRRWALKDLDLNVPAGRIVALVGPNGAGKTTFLQLAIGLAEPSAGTIRCFGLLPRRDAREYLPKVGYAAQDPPLFRRFSVSDLLEMGSRLNPCWDAALATARLRRLGISLKHSVATLSGGMRAQVALVLALAKLPDLLLLDEPMASLDPLARHEFMQLLMEASAEQGLTVVLSSHIIGDLRATCDYLVVLTRGRTQLAGDMEAIVSDHQRLVGPADLLDVLSDSQQIVHVDRAQRQVSTLVRMRQPLLDPRWESYPVDLDQIVLAYLSRGSADSGGDAASQTEAVG
ncbi:MAG: ABC transporter ATP-binding protein [Chloroflexi bacterium]|nr:MAG: ABC transporter ATP-binding protein [Chloroflexota bacterium]